MSTILFDETFTEYGNNIDYRVQVARNAWMSGYYDMTISASAPQHWSDFVAIHGPASATFLLSSISDIINRKSPWLLRGSPHWQLCRRLADVIGPQRKPCDCGGERVGTTHSHWCSSRESAE